MSPKSYPIEFTFKTGVTRMRMKTIDWNKMSELGLIEKINTEILHPMGLAISRDLATGFSMEILISSDGVWEYDDSTPTTILPEDELKRLIEELPYT